MFTAKNVIQSSECFTMLTCPQQVATRSKKTETPQQTASECSTPAEEADNLSTDNTKSPNPNSNVDNTATNQNDTQTSRVEHPERPPESVFESNNSLTSENQTESDPIAPSASPETNEGSDAPGPDRDIASEEGSSSRLPSETESCVVEVINLSASTTQQYSQSEAETQGSGSPDVSTTGNGGDQQTEVVEMSEHQRLEEKLKQFQNDAKEQGDDREKRELMGGGMVQMSESEKQRRRNLIFDEERFEETFLKCLICREVYNDTDKLPKMLHCHHTFCMDCLYQMYRVEGEFRQSLTSVFRNMPLTVKVQCPTCREGIIISEAELRRLPNDHTIMELLCFVNKTGKNDVQYCPKHQMQPLNFFCEPCIMPVCCDCTVIDHKESKGHRVVNVDEAMKKYTPIVEDTLSDIRKEKATLASKREVLENTQEDMNQIQAGISDQIRKVFDSIREVLDERERELHDVAESEVERKQAIIHGHLNTIADRESDLNMEFNSLQAAKDDRDISLIFTGHKSARDLLARKVFIPTNSTAGFSITFQFSSRADTVIKQQVANLGDIIFHS